MTSRLMVISCIVMFIAIYMTTSVCAKRKWKKKYKVLTYNAGLVDFIDLGDPDVTNTRTVRRDAIIESLKSSPADIVCLQETYFGSDVEAMVNGLRTKYPHSFSKLHRNGDLPQQTVETREPLCTSNLTTLGSCLVEKGCLTKTSLRDFTACVGTLCFTEFTTDVQDQKCLSCVILNLPNIDAAVARCTNLDGNANNVELNAPGIVLFSKTPLKDAKSVDYYGNTITINERGYVQAKVDNKLTVVCTHMSADGIAFIEPFISANFTSYEEANFFESETMIENFQNDPKVVLLGDFNNGLSFVPSLQDTFPESYNILASAFNNESLQVCTVCAGNNSFRMFDPLNEVVDHVFGGKSVTVYPPKRVLTETINFMGFEINLSDHYGVLAKVAVSCKSGG